MYRRRFLSAFVAAAMAVSLVGCAGGSGAKTETGKDQVQADTQAEKTVLTFWGHQEFSWNDSYKEIADLFMKENPDIEIKLEFFPYDQFESKVQTSLLSKGEGADIYELWGGWGIDFAPTGALAKIPDDMAQEIKADFYEPTTGALEYEGNLYGIPLEYNIENGAMLVNKKLLDENGLTLPETWDELVADAKKASVIEGGMFVTKGFDFVNWDSVMYLLLSMILSEGGQYLEADGTVNFDTPEARTAFEELHRLVVEEQVTDLEGLTSTGSEMEGYQQLFAGTNMIVPRGPWTIAEGIQTFELVLDEDFCYASMPWYGKNPAFAAETGWSVAVNANSKNQEAAFRFLNYFYSDEMLLKHDLNCTLIPPKKSLAQSGDLLEKMPYVEPLVSILDKGQFIGRFNTDQFKESINNAFVDYCSGVYGDAGEALAAAQEAINASVQ